MNYECEFRDFLLMNLKEKFQIYDDVNLLLYLYLRYECIANTSEINPQNFMSFLIKELFIIDENNGVLFDNQFLKYEFSMENSLYNIFYEWDFILFHSQSSNLNGNRRNISEERIKHSNKIKDAAKKKLQKYKQSIYKEELLKYFKLLELNRIFEVSIEDVPDLSGVHQLDIRLTDEELLGRYLQAENFNSANVKTITESQLRDYLFTNLHLIEDGLKPIEKESLIGEGRVDILAKDRNDDIVVIELKTGNDKRLIWQCMYYQEILNCKFKNTKKIRTIVVAPEYPEYLLIVLNKIQNIELYTYQLHSTSNKIEEIHIKHL